MKEKMLKERNNCHKFWSISKEIRHVSKHRPNIDVKEFEEHFKDVFNEEIEQDVTKNRVTDEANELRIPELDDPITELEVGKAILKLKSGKASGLDQICSELLKSTVDIVSPALCDIFNKVYDLCYFPIEWSKSIIIQKKGTLKMLTIMVVYLYSGY